MAYGDDGTTGDLTRLCEALKTVLSQHGITVELDQLNSYDLQMNLTGHGAARLLYLLVDRHEPSAEVLEDLVGMMVDGIG